MNSDIVIVAQHEHISALKEEIAQHSPGQWINFAYGPGESAVRAGDEDFRLDFLAVRGHEAQLDTPCFERKSPRDLNACQVHYGALLGERIARQIGVDPRTVVCGPEIGVLFSEVHQKMVQAAPENLLHRSIEP